ncbi:Zn-ribbon domain-containing OB-fold protein [Sphingorhabdus pulchriflava]|nr:OB-fold domain-containing protein [Sphingorhabdus pulchriflava]
MTYINATGQIGAEGRYWDALAKGRIELPRCKGCGKWHWPAVWRCGECGSWDHEWVEQPMAGTIFTWTRTHHRFGGTEGIALPYVTALVELASVPVRLQGLLEGVEQDLKIGAQVVGRVGSTPFGDAQIPSLRWKIA